MSKSVNLEPKQHEVCSRKYSSELKMSVLLAQYLNLSTPSLSYQTYTLSWEDFSGILKCGATPKKIKEMGRSPFIS